MTNNKLSICTRDNTIVFGYEAGECNGYTPSETWRQPNCANCQHSKPTNQPLSVLLETMDFKPPVTCPYPCLFRNIVSRGCSKPLSRTDEDCGYGRRRHREFSPVSLGSLDFKDQDAIMAEREYFGRASK